MKPAPFAYVRPETLEEALELLAQHGDDARILAGGQSLIPMMNFRLAQPEILIDINRIPELRGITLSEGGVSIRATTRYADIERESALATSAPLIHRAMPLVAHPTIRNRGTIGGSLANADPSAELPACTMCAGATVVLASAGRGKRLVPAADFFKGTYETAAKPDELLFEIHMPVAKPEERFAIMEIAPRHGDFALAGLAARASVADGQLRDVALVFFSVCDKPVAAMAAQACLEGTTAGDRHAVDEAAHLLSLDIEFREDHQLGALHRQRLAGTLLRRVAAKLSEPEA